MKYIKSIIISLCFMGFLNVQAEELISYSDKIQAKGKNVLLILGSDNCPYCDILKKDINKNKKLNGLVKKHMNVYYVPVDKQKNIEIGDKNPAVKTTSLSLKMQFGSRVTPTIVMFNENWEKIIQLPGYADPNQMEIFVKYLGKKIYKEKDLETYLKQEGLI